MDSTTTDTQKVKALFLDQPKASSVAKKNQVAVLLSKNSKYKGEVLICSTGKKVYGLLHSSMIATAELIEVKPVNDFGPNDWTACNLTPHRKHEGKFGYFFKNVQRVVEIPIRPRSAEKLSDLDIISHDVVKYPQTLTVDKKGFEIELAKLTKTDNKLWSAHARHQPHLLQSLLMFVQRTLGRFRKLFFNV